MHLDLMEILTRCNPTPELVLDLQRLITGLVSLDRDISGIELFDGLELLGIDDPEVGFCKLVGTDEYGRVCCHACPLGPQPSGCLDLFGPVIRKALSKNVKAARLNIVAIIHFLDTLKQVIEQKLT